MCHVKRNTNTHKYCYLCHFHRDTIFFYVSIFRTQNNNNESSYPVPSSGNTKTRVLDVEDNDVVTPVAPPKTKVEDNSGSQSSGTKVKSSEDHEDHSPDQVSIVKEIENSPYMYLFQLFIDYNSIQITTKRGK